MQMETRKYGKAFRLCGSLSVGVIVAQSVLWPLGLRVPWGALCPFSFAALAAAWGRIWETGTWDGISDPSNYPRGLDGGR